MKAERILLVIATVVFSVSGPAAADVLYELTSGATFQEGCVGPCLCPIMLSEEVTGTFLLAPTGSDPLFTNYQLNGISWTVLGPDGKAAHEITGQGTYKLGGEVALTQQLVLDVDIDGGGTEHLDSGLIPGGSEFPLISVSVSRGTSCFNTWMTLQAAPKQGDLPVAVLESPVDGRVVSGILPIYGWALDKKGIIKVELFIDDQWIANIPYGGTRNDVKTAYPDYPDAENSGFAMIFNYSVLTSGDHSIRVRVHNQDGLTKDLDAKVTVKKFHGELVEKVIPDKRRLNHNVVTVDGIDKTYDIKIDWSNISQGFEIIDVIPK